MSDTSVQKPSIADGKMKPARPPLVWWLKVVLTLALMFWGVTGIAHRDHSHGPPETWYTLPSPPEWTYLIARILAIGGGAFYIASYCVLRGPVSRLDQPTQLVASGLYRHIRHPMYLADIIWTSAFVFLAWDGVGLLLWLGLIGAIVLTALAEDGALSSRFPEEHEQWRRHSWLLLPGVL